MKHDWSVADGWGRALASTAGGGVFAVVFLIAAGAVPTRLGMSPSLAAALGVWLVVPAWVTAAVAVLLARSGRRAWLGLAAATAALGAASAAALWL